MSTPIFPLFLPVFFFNLLLFFAVFFAIIKWQVSTNFEEREARAAIFRIPICFMCFNARST